jgi:hypothetical protein
MKIKQTVIGIALLIGVIGVFNVQPSFADTTNDSCGVQTSIISCNNVKVDKSGKSLQNSALWSLLLTAINILTAGIGIAAVAGVVYGSIMYASAGGSPDQVKKARGIIVNVVIGIVAYALMYSFLNFIIPGGIFSP